MSRRAVGIVILLWIGVCVFCVGALTATREKIVVGRGNGFVKGRCLSCGDSTKSKRLFRFKF